MNRSILISKNHVSIGDAAEILGVSIDTLRRWEKKGFVSAHRSPGKHRYFLKKDLTGLFNERSTSSTSRTKTNIHSLKVNKNEKLEKKVLEIPPSIPTSVLSEPLEESLILNDSPVSSFSPEIPSSIQSPESVPFPKAIVNQNLSTNSNNKVLKIFYIFLGLFLLTDVILLLYWLGLSINIPLL